LASVRRKHEKLTFLLRKKASEDKQWAKLRACGLRR